MKEVSGNTNESNVVPLPNIEDRSQELGHAINLQAEVEPDKLWLIVHGLGDDNKPAPSGHQVDRVRIAIFVPDPNDDKLLKGVKGHTLSNRDYEGKELDKEFLTRMLQRLSASWQSLETTARLSDIVGYYYPRISNIMDKNNIQPHAFIDLLQLAVEFHEEGEGWSYLDYDEGYRKGLADAPSNSRRGPFAKYG